MDIFVLIFFFTSGHLDVVKLLIEGGANVNAANVYKYTALIRAAENKNGLIFNEQF